jgi:two-component system cell cycle response regulator
MSSMFPHGLRPGVIPDQSYAPAAGPLTEVEAFSTKGDSRNEEALADLPHRVLLVEPSPTEATWLRNELLASKFDVYTARDLITATQALTIFRPSIVLTQMRLPTYGGLELLRRWKEDIAAQSIPVILYSDFATAGERIQALDMGAVDVLAKPFVSDELIARVRAALKVRLSVSILERRAHRDSLTGLANRGVLEDQLVRHWDDCRRRETPLSVVIVDLDHFKTINDTYGHGAGDDVLRETAKVLAHSVRSSDLVARFGGEEFVVVAPSCSIKEAVELAQRFRDKLRDRKITVDGTVISVTASVGVATADWTQRGPAEELLRQADEALYQAKRSGRDAIWIYDLSQKIPKIAVATGLHGSYESTHLAERGH